MAFVIRRRAVVAAAVSATAWSASRMRPVHAQASAKTGLGVYPVAVPTYQVQFVAQEKGFFRDEGYDFKLVQGGSGVKTREILASRQADFAIADILHVLQLNKNGRPTRALNAVDTRAPGVRFAIRKDLYDQGIDTVQKAAAWKRPTERRRFSASPRSAAPRICGRIISWSALAWPMPLPGWGVGNVDTMLGSLKTRQIDVLSTAISLVAEAEKNGWGKQIYSPSDAKTWNEVIGGPVPVNNNFCLLSMIEKDPEKVQAYVNAIWRATQWIKAHSPEEIQDTIERFVGSTSRQANLLEIGELKDVADWNGLIGADAYARGEKVWYGELTGLKPIKREDAVEEKFLKAAHAKYPA